MSEKVRIRHNTTSVMLQPEQNVIARGAKVRLKSPDGKWDLLVPQELFPFLAEAGMLVVTVTVTQVLPPEPIPEKLEQLAKPKLII